MDFYLKFLVYILVTWYYAKEQTKQDTKMSDTLGYSLSNKLSLSGFSAVLYGWLTNAEVAILTGILITIGGFVVSFYFKRRQNARERAESLLRQEIMLREDERKEELHRELLRQYRLGNINADE